MKDLRIVIVSWNVESLLDRCLSSLDQACGALDWDVVVVDNHSHDRSLEITKTHRAAIIANPDNRGFAKACNQGISGSDARYVLLLNPDTECPAGSLQKLVQIADQHPEAGIVGPKLLNTDGSVQASIRRFPRVWSQAGIMLKLHNVFPGLFKRYFAEDLSLEREQDVDQVMGACFLIRRALIEQIGTLDERYFIWFEEVDYCRQAQAHGWKIRYVPSVSVTHHGGQSFGQVFSFKKQGYFNDSLVKYFKKWQPTWQWVLVWALQPASLAMAWLIGMLGIGGRGSRGFLHRDEGLITFRSVMGWMAVIFGVELISALTIFRDTPNAIACLIAGLLVGIIAFRKPTLGLALVALELVIGSKGSLLQIWGWPGIVPLRVLMFGTFMLGWSLKKLTIRGWVGSWKDTWMVLRHRIEWILLVGFVLYAIVRGFLISGGPVVADANAWIFLLLLVPVLDLYRTERQGVKRDVVPAVVAGLVWLGLKTLGLEYIFSHGFASISPQLYLWVRRTGVGEVTLVTANAFRIFMQSYVYALPAVFFGASYYFTTHDKGLSQYRALLNALTFCGIFLLAISLSRSMWIGTAVGLLVLAVYYLKREGMKSLVRIAQGSLKLAGWGALSLIVIFTTLAFPIPHVDVASLGALFGSRASTSDAASVSRWRLLSALEEKISEHPILGSGFGATVTYKTSDPRILAQNPTGLYTTYAFEWGWLEHWIKFGVFGFLLMILLVIRIGVRLVSAKKLEPWMRYAALASLVGLAVTHIFTPYLNHPLGFGYLFFLEAMTEV
jgi:N-acetylglucosaminyl-diphospho-decaprenol L-rhamnosyltransferase